jgi:hypothetical protein
MAWPTWCIATLGFVHGPDQKSFCEIMITVYRLLPDINNFQSVLTDDIDAWPSSFDGNPIGKSWKSPPCYPENLMKPRPDFWPCVMPATFALASNALGLKGRARPIVTFLDQSCEVLPLKCEGVGKLLLCNVTHVVNCLDKTKSEPFPDMPGQFLRLVFHPKRFGYSLFRIPETRMGEILCVEGLSDPEDEFKATVEKLGLTGLRFKRIWSDSYEK